MMSYRRRQAANKRDTSGDLLSSRVANGDGEVGTAVIARTSHSKDAALPRPAILHWSHQIMTQLLEVRKRKSPRESDVLIIASEPELAKD